VILCSSPFSRIVVGDMRPSGGSAGAWAPSLASAVERLKDLEPDKFA
jgi:hypothetical protein